MERTQNWEGKAFNEGAISALHDLGSLLLICQVQIPPLPSGQPLPNNDHKCQAPGHCGVGKLASVVRSGPRGEVWFFLNGLSVAADEPPLWESAVTNLNMD